MWRSFFFAVGIILFLIGLQCLAVQEFRVDQNNRLFSFAQRANRALEARTSQGNFRAQNNPGLPSGQAPNFANQQQFSLPSSESYYGGPSRFQSSSYGSNQSAYGGGVGQFRQQSQPVNPVANNTNLQQVGFNSNAAKPRPRAPKSYPVTDWMPWGFLAAGTIISLYTNSLGSSHYSGD